MLFRPETTLTQLNAVIHAELTELYRLGVGYAWPQLGGLSRRCYPDLRFLSGLCLVGS